MAGQDPKGDQSPGRASGRTQGLEQGLPGIKAPLFLHGWVVGGFLGWVFVGGDGSGVAWVDDGMGWGWYCCWVVEWVVVGWVGVKVHCGFNGECRGGWCASEGWGGWCMK